MLEIGKRMYKDSRLRSASLPDATKTSSLSLGNSCIIPTVGVVERAFQLAEECTSHFEIRAKLKQEGYPHVDGHLSGGKIRSDLAKVLKRRA